MDGDEALSSTALLLIGNRNLSLYPSLLEKGKKSIIFKSVEIFSPAESFA